MSIVLADNGGPLSLTHSLLPLVKYQGCLKGITFCKATRERENEALLTLFPSHLCFARAVSMDPGCVSESLSHTLYSTLSYSLFFFAGRLDRWKAFKCASTGMRVYTGSGMCCGLQLSFLFARVWINFVICIMFAVRFERVSLARLSFFLLSALASLLALASSYSPSGAYFPYSKEGERVALYTYAVVFEFDIWF